MINLQSRLLRDRIYYGFIGHKYVQLHRYDGNMRNRIKLGPIIQNLLILLKIFLLCDFSYK